MGQWANRSRRVLLAEEAADGHLEPIRPGPSGSHMAAMSD